MSLYNHGKIYKICNSVPDNIYIGSTCNLLYKRLHQHRSNFKSWINGEKKYMTSYKIFEEDDIENVRIILIEEFSCNSKMELQRKERHYIKTLECVNKVVPGRTDKEYYKDNIDKIKKYNEQNKEKISKTRKLYREKNRDKNKEYQKEWYEQRKDELNERRRRNYEENKEVINTLNRTYRENN